MNILKRKKKQTSSRKLEELKNQIRVEPGNLQNKKGSKRILGIDLGSSK